MAEYELVKEVLAHDGAGRSLGVLPSTIAGNENSITLVSGGRDRICKLISASEDGRDFTEKQVIYDHEHWVNAVLPLPTGGFVTGCHDNKIRRYSNDGTLITRLDAHAKPVVSLALNPKTGELISGSWDGTAKTWKIEATNLINTSTLPGHENGVCVLGLPNGNIATGSAGQKVGAGVAGFQIRIWKDGTVVKSMTEHEASIRCLSLGPDQSTFYSTSNDGSTREWTMDGTLVKTLRNPVSNDGSCAFSFAVSLNAKTGEILTANDDCCVRVWNGEDMIQQIMHPTEVWWVVALTNGDIASAAGDGFVRIFSRSDERKAQQSVRDYYVEQTQKTLHALAAKASGGGGGMDASKLQPIEDAGPGNTPGEVKLFSKNGVAWAYSWSAESFTWVEVGQAMGEAGNSGQEIDGVRYDKVWDIEVEEPGVGVRKLKLGVNNGDNPYAVAQAFIDKHGLRYDNLQQIVDFINQNRGNTAPTFEMVGGSGMDDVIYGNTEATTQKVAANAQFPMRMVSGLGFDKVKLSKVLDKLNEFNADVSDGLKLNDQELGTMNALVDVLAQANRYHSSTFTRMHIAVIEKLTAWDEDHIFPVFDLIRIFFTHPLGAKTLGDARSRKVMLQALKLATPDAPLPVVLTATRTVANLFRHPDGAEYAVRSLMAEEGIDLAVKPVRDLVGFDNKSVRLAVATILFNSANALYHTKQSSVDLCSVLASAALELAEIGIKRGEAETVRRSLCCIGTLLTSKVTMDGGVLDSLSDTIESAESLKDESLSKCILHLKGTIQLSKN